MLSDLHSLGLLIAYVLGTWYDFWFGLSLGMVSTGLAAAFVMARQDRGARMQYRVGWEAGIAQATRVHRRINKRRAGR